MDLKEGDVVTVVLIGGDKTVLKGKIVSVRISDLDPTPDAAVGLIGRVKPNLALLGQGADDLVAGRVLEGFHQGSPKTEVYVLALLANAPPT